MLQHIDWFADFLVAWADDWGRFLDTPESFDDTILATFTNESPRFRIQDSMIGDPPRSNNPSGWLTFNQFFARELNPGLRPVTAPDANTTVVVPADCTFKPIDIDDDGSIPPITVKGTHTYATVQQLLHGSAYADAFDGGSFIHLFLGPYSYHRFHTPVGGTVKECYPLAGQVYLAVALSNGQQDHRSGWVSHLVPWSCRSPVDEAAVPVTASLLDSARGPRRVRLEPTRWPVPPQRQPCRQ